MKHLMSNRSGWLYASISLLPALLLAACMKPGTMEQAQTETPAATPAASEPVSETPAVDKTEQPPNLYTSSGQDEFTQKTLPSTATSPSPDNPASPVYKSITGELAGTGAPGQPVSQAYQLGASSTVAALNAPGLPKDRFGLIDWIAMVDEGHIEPHGSLDPSVPDAPPFDMNVLIPAKGDFVNDVMFRHKTHTYWLSCEACHPKIFVMAKGTNNMTMVGIREGKWCGQCHGRVSFPLTDCTRCHSEPKANAANAQ